MVFRQIVAFSFLVNCILAYSKIPPHGYEYPVESQECAEEALFLTPFLRRGNIQEARDSALVRHKEFGNVISYSGFLSTRDSNIFFWFFPAENKSETAPVLLWLSGGPGQSSLYGLFLENGPFHVTSAKTLKRREHSWTKTHNVIYIDIPFGTGYSFPRHRNGLTRSEEQISSDSLQFVEQFFELFPEFRRNDFYVGGESFAGKYVPCTAHAISEYNAERGKHINLKGLVIGNGLIDMQNQLVYSDFYWCLGLIDANSRSHLYKLENEIRQHIWAGEFPEAVTKFNKLFISSHGGTSIVQDFTGLSNYENYLFATKNYDEDRITEFVQLTDIRTALHVGDTTFFNDRKQIDKDLAIDTPQSVAPLIGKLAEKYKVLLYVGQLGLKVPHTSISNVISKLHWAGAAEYKLTPRQQWWVGKDLAGYWKIVGNLNEVLVRNAGHKVSADQPSWALDLITKFTRNQPFRNHAPSNQ